MSSNSQNSAEPQDLKDLIGKRNLSVNNRTLTHSQLYLCAVIIGIFGGIVATIYYFVLEGMMHGMWHTLPEIVEPYFPNWLPTNNYVWIARGRIFGWFSPLFYGASWRNGSGGG